MTTQAKAITSTRTYQQAQALLRAGIAQAPQTARHLWATERHWLWLIVPLAFVIFRPYRFSWNSWFGADATLIFQPFVPLAVAYLIWDRRQQIVQQYQELAFLFPADSPKRRGKLWPVLVGCFLMVIGCMTMLTPLTILSLLIILVGCVYYLYGPFVLGKMAVPLLFLLVMVPPPGVMLLILTQKLQVGSAIVAAEMLKPIFHTVTAQGVFITLPNYQLEVTPTCSGTSIVLPVLAMTLWLALYRQMRIGVVGVLLLLAATIAVLMNIIRIFMMGLIGGYNPDLATRLHDSNSIVFTALSFYLTYLVANQLMKPRRRVSEFEADLAQSVGQGKYPDA